MKIAVCLSGQPRVIDYAAPSILNFFSGEHEFDYFCHSWDYNSYKRRKENPDIGEFPVWWEDDEKVDRNQLISSLFLFNPKKHAIHGAEVLGKRFIWDSLMYSLMYANYLKKQYEIENNFRYDIVVRSRYDIIFPANNRFVVNKLASKDNYLDLFTIHAGRMTYEYNRVNASDQLFYGSSLGMDMLCDTYRHIYTRLKDMRLDDLDYLGPGTYISDFAEDRNLRLTPVYRELSSTVYRKEMIPSDPINNFEEHRIFNDSLYKIKYD